MCCYCLNVAYNRAPAAAATVVEPVVPDMLTPANLNRCGARTKKEGGKDGCERWTQKMTDTNHVMLGRKGGT